MNHLFDSCTIMHEIADIEEIERVIDFCYKKKEKFSVTTEIIKELEPPASKSDDTEECWESARTIYSYMQLFVKSKKVALIDCWDKSDIEQNIKQIRKRFYGWMENPRFCNELIRTGKLTSEEYRSYNFRYKDIGECTLIAVALLDPMSYIIISEDAGRAYKFPNINIFDYYRKQGLTIMKYQNWKEIASFPVLACT